ncbi:MAG: AbrB/MazE/SpoVT family DNA-binding domain-containing protein [Thermomicrobiales bacterium]
MPVSKLVRVQEKGQVTLPANLRRKLGIKKGDFVAVEEKNGALLITPQEVLAAQALDEIGEILRSKGLTLDELIESGRSERASLLGFSDMEKDDQ